MIYTVYNMISMISKKMKADIAVRVFIILTCGMAMAACCAGEEFSDENLRVLEGKVVNVNVSKSAITVSGGIQIDFQVSPDTKICRDTPDIDFAYDIKLSDIDVGDYVSVEYWCKDTESRVPAKVLAVTVQYKAKPSE